MAWSYQKLCIREELALCGSLPQRISRPTTNFWSTSRVKQALVNQNGPRQCQRPLDRAPLATVAKNADQITLVSQSELLLLRDKIWSAYSNSDTPSSNAAKWSPQPLGSSTSALLLYGRLPAHSHPSTERRGPLSHKPAWHSQSFAGIHQDFTWLSFQIPELTSHKLKNSYMNNATGKLREHLQRMKKHSLQRIAWQYWWIGRRNSGRLQMRLNEYWARQTMGPKLRRWWWHDRKTISL
jgi:hypothetical protein